MSRLALVTGADSAYFHYAKGLVSSVRSVAPPDACELCFIDFGCAAVELDWLDRHVDRIAPGRWDIDFPQRAAAPRHLQALTCRPFLPGYFPGHDVYLWLDADSWVQDWLSVELFVAAARRGEMAVVPEIDRAYRYHYDLGGARTWMHGCYAKGFGRDVADHLWWMPIISAGVYALEGPAPWWRAWERRLREGLANTTRFIDQTALNFAIHAEEIRAHLLPSTCHWLCNYASPLLDEETGAFLEPYLPHARLGIVHLAGPLPKKGPVAMRTTRGRTLERWLKYRFGEY